MSRRSLAILLGSLVACSAGAPPGEPPRADPAAADAGVVPLPDPATDEPARGSAERMSGADRNVEPWGYQEPKPGVIPGAPPERAPRAPARPPTLQPAGDGGWP